MSRPSGAGWWRWFRTVGSVLLVVLLTEYVLVPKWVQARAELSMVGDVSLWAVAGGFLFEGVSLVAYTQLTQVLLHGHRSLPFGVQLRIDLTGFGLSRVLPGSGAASAAVRYRLMVGRGVDATGALSLAAVQAVVAALALLGVTTAAAVALVPTTGANTFTWVLLTLSLGAAALVVWLWQWGQTDSGAAPASGSRWIVAALSVRGRVQSTLRDGHVRRQSLAWAAANWLLDAACLGLCVAAYGGTVPVAGLVLAYGVASLLGALPLTPGGIGVIEGTLVPGLVLAGVAGGPAVAGVLTWRLLQYWLPIPIGLACWATLRRPARISA